MRSSVWRGISGLATVGLLLFGMGGCPMNPGNGNGNNNSGGGGNSLRAVITSQVVSGAIKVGDGFIAFGTNSDSGISYIRPGQNGNAATNLSNFVEFVDRGFNVCGSWIICRDFDGFVYLYNTTNDQIIDVDESQLSLFSGAAFADEFWSDGRYIVTWADPNRVSDGLPIKLIDCGVNPPTLTSFTQSPPADTTFRANERVQMAIDADAMQFVVQVVDNLYLYDINEPTAAPKNLDFSAVGGITNATQLWLDDGYVLYQDFDGASNGRRITRLADFVNDTTEQLSENPTFNSSEIYLEAGYFGYFLQETDADVITNQQARSAFGRVTDSGIEFLVTNDDAQPIKNNDPGDGLFGYGDTVSISPNGRYWFIAGGGNASVAEYLQVSINRGAWRTFDDPENNDDGGVIASEVRTTDDICAFMATGNRLGYVLLD